MKFEQPDLDFLTEEENEKGLNQKLDQKKEKENNTADETGNESENNLGKPDDDLSFDCEICQDSPGGCPSCGWGRNTD